MQQIVKREGWRELDAVLLPAGFYKLQGWYGPLASSLRLERLDEDEAGQVCTGLARRLQRRSPGCLLVVGVDAGRHGPWRGDMMTAAFGAAGPVALSRMIYPVRGSPTLVFPGDAEEPGRFVRLASGETALLCVCYDAFALAELARGREGERGNLTYIADAQGHGRLASSSMARDLLLSFDRQLHKYRPNVALIAIHRFRRPGRELFWQRHGVATASAALEGGLAIGASHFTDALPHTIDRSPLAAFGVARRHLSLGGHRKPREFQPVDGFETALPWAPHRRALVRLFQTP